MKKIIFMLSILLFSSCYEQELNQPTTGRKKRKKVETEEVVKDTIKTVEHDTIVQQIKEPAYKCKYPDLVSKILISKRTKIFQKEGRDASYYSNDFLDIFEIDKTNPEILKFYDAQIDSLVEKLSNKGALNFDAIAKDSGTIIR